MNVLWASPMISPPPFVRLMNTIDADVWLFQEWDIRERDQPRIPVADVEAWLEDNLAPKSDWTVIAGDQRGVLIASRLPLRPQGPIEIKATAIGDRRAMIERSVRYVAGVVETPGGEILLGNIHLKCCGGRGDSEDRQRIAEATAVSVALDEALSRSEAPGVVLGGDFNLVGSPIPLAILKNGLDPSGIDLKSVDASVLGDNARYTWTEAGSRFPAGRLDYVLRSPSSLDVAGSWILDTARLSDESLSAMGLERSDSAATDHRPIIVDLVWND
jgi:endonuclease/exonuclease/phosphatase family metal-dependent hydrolase